MDYTITIGDLSFGFVTEKENDASPSFPGDRRGTKLTSEQIETARALGVENLYPNGTVPKTNTYELSAEALHAALDLFDVQHVFYGGVHVGDFGLFDIQGTANLESYHGDIIDRAIEEYVIAHPGVVAGYPEPVPGGDRVRGPFTPESAGRDSSLAFMRWMQWWVNYALHNYEEPAIMRS